MDPNANLKEQIELAQDLLARHDRNEKLSDYDSARLAELVISLHIWINSGGFLPAVWNRHV